jgi:ribosomal protein S18 acetylase RimI-like enzyme
VSSDGLTVRPVAEGEEEEFLDWFERYWDELETFNDYPDEFSRSEYRRLLEQRESRYFWWADVDGRHAGFCVFTVRQHWYRRDITTGYVDEFYVEPEARKAHLGSELGRLMLDEFRRRGVQQVELSVLRRNERAIGFWTSLGFGMHMHKMALLLGD